MVAARRSSGILDTILLRLATFLEKNDSIIRKVKGMIYPAVIFSAPASRSRVADLRDSDFQSMFASVNLALPLPTFRHRRATPETSVGDHRDRSLRLRP